MPLATRPFRFSTTNRRLTQRELDERERNTEFERRHRNCEDDPCDDCRPRRFCAEDDCPDTVLEGEYLCPRHAAEEERSLTGVSRWALAILLVVGMSLSVGCGTEPSYRAAPPRPDLTICPEPGDYCVGGTLCQDHAPIACDAVTGGWCSVGVSDLAGNVVNPPSCEVMP